MACSTMNAAYLKANFISITDWEEINMKSNKKKISVFCKCTGEEYVEETSKSQATKKMRELREK